MMHGQINISATFSLTHSYAVTWFFRHCTLSAGLLTFINVMSVKLYVQMQNVFSVCKLVVCGVIIGCGIFLLCTGELCKGTVENMIDRAHLLQ